MEKAPLLNKEGLGVVIFTNADQISLPELGEGRGGVNHQLNNVYLCKFKPKLILFWKRLTKPDLSALSGNPTLGNRP